MVDASDDVTGQFITWYRFLYSRRHEGRAPHSHLVHAVALIDEAFGGVNDVRRHATNGLPVQEIVAVRETNRLAVSRHHFSWSGEEIGRINDNGIGVDATVSDVFPDLVLSFEPSLWGIKGIISNDVVFLIRSGYLVKLLEFASRQVDLNRIPDQESVSETSRKIGGNLVKRVQRLQVGFDENVFVGVLFHIFFDLSKPGNNNRKDIASS